jgi:hypothetical protein
MNAVVDQTKDGQTIGASRSFRARGSRNGSLVHVRWDDGVLGGDPPTVDLMLAEAEIAMATATDPVVAGQEFARRCRELDGEPLQDPQFVFDLVRRVFDTVREVSSEPPDLLAGQTSERK